MRRIFEKEGNLGSFRFSKKSSELSASPRGGPELVTLDFSDRKQSQQELRDHAPHDANAYILGAKVYVDSEYKSRTAIQYYKIQVIYMP